MHCVSETESESSAAQHAWCQRSCVRKESGGWLTFKELAAVSLTGLEFDRDDVTERLVQELDGNTLSRCVIAGRGRECGAAGRGRGRGRFEREER